MEPEFITPQEAVERLRKRHYRGGRKAKASDLSLRQPLLGVLRAGVVDWRCSLWKEVFISDRGATYDARGGWTAEGPTFWPADFWQPALAADDDYWLENSFISSGNVSQLTAPHKVRLWLESNGESRAEWSRSAKGVVLDWTAAASLLSGAGWQSWADRPTENDAPEKLAWHYREGYENLVVLALLSPERFRKERLSDLIEQAFDTPAYRDDRGRWMGGGIDIARVKNIAHRIRTKLAGDEGEDTPPP